MADISGTCLDALMRNNIPNTKLKYRHHKRIYISADIQDSRFEFPTILNIRYCIEHKEAGSTKIVEAKEIRFQSSYKTIHSIIKNSFNSTGLYDCRIAGETFYIGKGTILDAEFRPIVIATAKVEINGQTMFTIGYKVYVSRAVYLHQTSFNSYIKNSVIPSFLKVHLNGYRQPPIDIIIGDMPKCITTINPVTDITCFKDIIKKDKASIIESIYE